MRDTNHIVPNQSVEEKQKYNTTLLGISKRVLRVILIPLICCVPIIVVFDFIVWIITGKMKDNGRCFICFIGFGQWKELI